MSQRRLAMKALHAKGKPMSVRQIEAAAGGIDGHRAMQEAAEYGLAESCGRGLNAQWRLTQLGIDLMLGKVVMVQPSREKGQRGRRSTFVPVKESA